MSSTDSTTMPDSPGPLPDALAGAAAATLSPARLWYWSFLRELWENRWLYIVPLIVAAVFLVGFAIGVARFPLSLPPQVLRHLKAQPLSHLVEAPFDFASFVLMGTYAVIAVIYCLAALHSERWDRSILFWKSLPVSDTKTVLAKATVPVIFLPLITFGITVLTHGIMLLTGSAVLLARGIPVAGLWAQMPLLSMWGALLYHLVTGHALYWAPFYGWLLLVGAWARRAAFLWASLPVAAVLIIEKLIFGTTMFGHMLLSQLGGASEAVVSFPPQHGNMPIPQPTLANLGAFLTSPNLWIGLAVFAAFLAAAVWVRRRQGPI